MSVELQVTAPAGSEAQEASILQRILTGQPDLLVERPPDAPVAPGEKGGALDFGRLLLSSLGADAVVSLVDGLKVYLSRSHDLSITLKNSDGTTIEVKAVNVAPDEIVKTTERLRALLAAT